MATRNFWLRNADRYFVATEPDEEEYNEFWFDDTLDDLSETATNCFGFSSMYGFAYKNYLRGVETRNEARAVPCSYEQSQDDIWEGDWTCELIPLVRPGYYSGGVLDFSIKVVSPTGEELTDSDVLNGNCIEDLVHNYAEYLTNYEGEEVTEGQQMTLFENVRGLIEQVTNKFYEFAEQSGLDEYALKGVFSNGEDVYVNLSEIKRKAGKE